jgi:hypothetical protein
MRIRTEGHGTWFTSGRSDLRGRLNHWFDCLVGCAAAASMCGVKVQYVPDSETLAQCRALGEKVARKLVETVGDE